MSDLTIEVKNDAMLGRLDESYLHTELIKKDKEIERLNKIIEIKNNRIQQLMKRTRSARINKAVEYIKEHCLYEEEYDYDYEENSYLSGISDEVAKKELLSILEGSDEE